MKNNRISILAVLLVLGLLPISSVSADTVEWQFVKQSCSSVDCNTAGKDQNGYKRYEKTHMQFLYPVGV